MKQINKSKFVLLLTLLIVMVVSFFYMKIEMSYAVFLMLSCILLFMMSKLYNIRKYYLALAQLLLLARSLFGGDIHTVYIV